MDKLSKLIKEARPLYRQRKRRRAIAKIMLMICMPAMLLCGMFQLYLEGGKVYVSLDNNNLQTELLEDSFDLLR